MGGEGSSVLGGEVENAFNPFSPEGQDGGKEGGNRLPNSGWGLAEKPSALLDGAKGEPRELLLTRTEILKGERQIQRAFVPKLDMFGPF